MDAQERFLAKVRQDGDCLVWTAKRDSDGYGVFWYQGKNRRAHRIAYLFANGEIDENLIVMHTCDNPSCVTPEHLKQGTPADNNRDAVEKGRKSSFLGTSNPKARLTEYQVIKIRQLAEVGIPKTELSKIFNTSRRNIHNILNGSRWGHISNTSHHGDDKLHRVAKGIEDSA